MVSKENAVRKHAALSLLGFVGGLILCRCFFGVDFTDESQYLAQGIAPLIGGQAFKTDLFLQQVTSLLLLPFLGLYAWLIGPTTGTALFFRLLWWCGACATSGIVYCRLKPRLGRWPAALVASLIIAFVPFNIPSPSYNSIGLLFLTLGLVAFEVLFRGQMVWLFLAAICYPPFGLAGAVVLGAALINPKLRLKALKELKKYLWLALCLGVGVLIYRERFQHSYFFTSQFGTFLSAEKLALLRAQLGQIFSPSHWHQLYPSTHYIVLGISAIGLIVYSRLKLLFPQSLLAAGWLCGIIAALGSSNGLINFAIGAMPFFLMTLTGLWLSFSSRIMRSILISGLVITNLAFIDFAFRTLYRESPIGELKVQIEAGPFKGLFTTPERADFLREIQADLASMAAQDPLATVFFFYNFPAGYLMSELTPQTHVLNLLPREYSLELRNILIPSSAQERPDWVVKIQNYPGGFSGLEDAALNAAFTGENYLLYLDRPSHSIYRINR